MYICDNRGVVAMESYDQRQERQTTFSKKRKNGKPHCNSRSLGDVPGYGREHGNDSFRVIGENSQGYNRLIINPLPNSSGGIISQLIQETQQQLACHKEQINFHKEQVEILQQRLSQLDEVYYQLNPKQ